MCAGFRSAQPAFGLARPKAVLEAVLEPGLSGDMQVLGAAGLGPVGSECEGLDVPASSRSWGMLMETRSDLLWLLGRSE